MAISILPSTLVHLSMDENVRTSSSGTGRQPKMPSEGETLALFLCLGEAYVPSAPLEVFPCLLSQHRQAQGGQEGLED